MNSLLFPGEIFSRDFSQQHKSHSTLNRESIGEGRQRAALLYLRGVALVGSTLPTLI